MVVPYWARRIAFLDDGSSVGDDAAAYVIESDIGGDHDEDDNNDNHHRDARVGFIAMLLMLPMD